MILPTKHIGTRRSLLGIGSEIIKLIDKPQTVSTLWEKARAIKGIRTFGIFILTLDFIYSLGIIEFKEGFIRRTN